MADAAPPVEAPKAKKKPNRLVVEEATNDDNSVRNKLPTSRAFLTLLVDLAQLLQQSRDDERVSLCAKTKVGGERWTQRRQKASCYRTSMMLSLDHR